MRKGPIMLADSVADAVSYLHQVRSKDDLSVFDHLAGVVKKVTCVARSPSAVPSKLRLPFIS